MANKRWVASTVGQVDERLKKQTAEASDKMVQRVGKALSDKMVKNIVMAAIGRDIVGINKALATRHNWEVTAEHRGEGRWTFRIRNMNAPYAGYIDAPDGPYVPMVESQVDVDMLGKWMQIKGGPWVIGPDRLAELITWRGHKSQAGRGYIRQAMLNTISDLGAECKVQVRQFSTEVVA